MTNASPPWEEDIPLPEDVDENTSLSECDATGYVTQGQFSALLQMVKDLSEKVRRQDIQLAGLINKTPGRPNPPSYGASAPEAKHEDGVLIAGKYRGKTHDWVAMNEPDYVRYLVDNGWHEKWGFTASHIEAAEKASKLKGPSR